MSSYPTAYDLTHRPGAVRRRDAFTVQNAIATLREKLVRDPRFRRWSNNRVEALADIDNMIVLARRYNNDARELGFRIP